MKNSTCLVRLLLVGISTTVVAARQTSQDGQQAGASARDITNQRSVKATPAKNLSPPPWISLRIDKSVPGLVPGVECPVSQVVSGVSERMKEFVENLQKFDATEYLEHFNVGVSGSRGKLETRRFDYVAIVTPSEHGEFQVEEYRNGSVDFSLFPAKIATTGLSTMALLFHPNQVSNFNLTCEGLAYRNGYPAWLVHFAQRPDRPNRLSGYTINGRSYAVPLKGRAWIDVDSYQVGRLEIELIKPVPEIELTEQDMAIDYGPVQFRTQGQLWLPLDAELYLEQGKRRFYRRHTLSNFKLFQVETAQKIQAPKEH